LHFKLTHFALDLAFFPFFAEAQIRGRFLSFSKIRNTRPKMNVRAPRKSITFIELMYTNKKEQYPPSDLKKEYRNWEKANLRIESLVLSKIDFF